MTLFYFYETLAKTNLINKDKKLISGCWDHVGWVLIKKGHMETVGGWIFSVLYLCD
jgi:hypothetical protein